MITTQNQGMAAIQNGLALLATHHNKFETDETALDALCMDLCDSVNRGVGDITPCDMSEHEAWKQEILLRFVKQLVSEQFNAGSLELLRQHIVEM